MKSDQELRDRARGVQTVKQKLSASKPKPSKVLKIDNYRLLAGSDYLATELLSRTPTKRIVLAVGHVDERDEMATATVCKIGGNAVVSMGLYFWKPDYHGVPVRLVLEVLPAPRRGKGK